MQAPGETGMGRKELHESKEQRKGETRVGRKGLERTCTPGTWRIVYLQFWRLLLSRCCWGLESWGVDLGDGWGAGNVSSAAKSSSLLRRISLEGRSVSWAAASSHEVVLGPREPSSLTARWVLLGGPAEEPVAPQARSGTSPVQYRRKKWTFTVEPTLFSLVN